MANLSFTGFDVITPGLVLGDQLLFNWTVAKTVEADAPIEGALLTYRLKDADGAVALSETRLLVSATTTSATSVTFSEFASFAEFDLFELERGGAYMLELEVDAEGLIDESDETDNIASAMIDIFDSLTLNRLGDAPATISMFAGGFVSFDISLRAAFQTLPSNQFADYALQFVLSQDQVFTADDYVIGTAELGDLSAGLPGSGEIVYQVSASDLTDAMPVPADFEEGTYYVGIIPDYTGLYYEFNETATIEIAEIRLIDAQSTRRSDVNGDGYDDIVFFNASTNAIGVIEMQGKSWSSPVKTGTGWEAAGIGRFDSDDRSSDLLWFNASTRTVGRFDFDGSNAPLWSGIGQAGTGWNIAGVGDFNGDSVDDILWQNAASGNIGQFRMSDSGTASWAGVGYVGFGWDIAGTGDFNGDGTDDILWVNASTGALGQMRMSASGATWQGITTLGAGYEVVGIGDFWNTNLDGTGAEGDDILVFNEDTQALGHFNLFTIGNENRVEWTNMGRAGDGWQVEGTGDFNADGTDDILWRSDDNQLGQYEMQGNSFSWSTLGTAGSDWDIIL